MALSTRHTHTHKHFLSNSHSYTHTHAQTHSQTLYTMRGRLRQNPLKHLQYTLKTYDTHWNTCAYMWNTIYMCIYMKDMRLHRNSLHIPCNRPHTVVPAQRLHFQTFARVREHKHFQCVRKSFHCNRKFGSFGNRSAVYLSL